MTSYNKVRLQIMKKKLLLGFSAVVFGTFTACTTDNLPTDSSGKKTKSLENTFIQEKQTSTDSFSSVAQDTLRQFNIIINESSSTIDNGDLGTIKDKRK